MKAINVDGQMTARELLSLVDGYYKLEKPIGYTMGGSGTMDYVSAEQELRYTTTDANPSVGVSFGAPVKNMTMPTIGELYHLKLEFQSGVVVEREVEFLDGAPMFAGSPTLKFSADMFDGLDEQGLSYMSCVKEGGTQGVMGHLTFNTSKDETIAKYGNSISITVTGKATSSTGEISGVININTDVKILDGITKVITSLADDTSYYIENVWQDGTAVEVSAMDEKSGDDEGEGSGGSGDFSTAQITFIDINAGESEGYAVVELPAIENDSVTIQPFLVKNGEPVTVTLPLYKGKWIIPAECLEDIDPETVPTTGGSITFDNESIPKLPFFIVTGDGAINCKSLDSKSPSA